MEDQDRLESHAVDNVLNDDEHNIAEEKADYKIGTFKLAYRTSQSSRADVSCR